VASEHGIDCLGIDGRRFAVRSSRCKVVENECGVLIATFHNPLAVLGNADERWVSFNGRTSAMEVVFRQVVSAAREVRCRYAKLRPHAVLRSGTWLAVLQSRKSVPEPHATTNSEASPLVGVCEAFNRRCKVRVVGRDRR